MGADKGKGEIINAISNGGGTLSINVTNKTHVLVIGERPGQSKVRAAMKKEIPIIDLASFHQLTTGSITIEALRKRENAKPTSFSRVGNAAAAKKSKKKIALLFPLASHPCSNNSPSGTAVPTISSYSSSSIPDRPPRTTPSVPVTSFLNRLLLRAYKLSSIHISETGSPWSSTKHSSSRVSDATSSAARSSSANISASDNSVGSGAVSFFFFLIAMVANNLDLEVEVESLLW